MYRFADLLKPRTKPLCDACGKHFERADLRRLDELRQFVGTACGTALVCQLCYNKIVTIGFMLMAKASPETDD